MTTILIRTLIIYTTLILTMRFMGKRQLGELEISDLVTTLLISEIASLPLTNTEIPLAHAILPILILMSLEVLLPVLQMKLPWLKSLFAVHPAILVKNGVPDRDTMRASRVSTEELISQLRQKDVTDVGDVVYAILEPNGQISVVQKDSSDSGMMHLIISDGRVNPRNLELAGRDQEWLHDLLQRKELTPKEVFMLMVDDSGKTRIFPITHKGGKA